MNLRPLLQVVPMLTPDLSQRKVVSKGVLKWMGRYAREKESFTELDRVCFKEMMGLRPDATIQELHTEILFTLLKMGFTLDAVRAWAEKNLSPDENIYDANSRFEAWAAAIDFIPNGFEQDVKSQNFLAHYIPFEEKTGLFCCIYLYTLLYEKKDPLCQQMLDEDRPVARVYPSQNMIGFNLKNLCHAVNSHCLEAGHAYSVRVLDLTREARKAGKDQEHWYLGQRLARFNNRSRPFHFFNLGVLIAKGVIPESLKR